MINNPVQFAVVREDPLTEAALVEEFECTSALVIASGGCTALTLRSLFPKLDVALVDFNPAQLALVAAKLKASELAEAARSPLLNVGTSSTDGLNASGNFESLFSALRAFLHDLVASRETMLLAFDTPEFDFAPWFNNRYWPVAFELFLSESLLNAMFGPAATQHAPKDSYPGYFQRVFERALQRPDRADNYFLHHLLLGHYRDRDDALPRYISHPPSGSPFEATCGTLDDVADLDRFDLLSISNIMDWLDDTEQRAVANSLTQAKPGAILLTRQLNNERDLSAVLGPEWAHAVDLSSSLLASDRSLFYNRMSVYRKSA